MAQQPRLPAPFLVQINLLPATSQRLCACAHNTVERFAKVVATFIGCFRERSLREQAVELFLNDLVTFAHARLEARAVQHGDLAPAVVDQSGTLQVPG